jgi:hypothetical protein
MSDKNPHPFDRIIGEEPEPPLPSLLKTAILIAIVAIGSLIIGFIGAYYMLG